MSTSTSHGTAPGQRAVIGALLGALLPTVIGAIVGAVLVPLIMYIAEQVIEGTINSVAAHIADALNQLLVPMDIPAVGFNLIFSDAHIDDVQIGCQVQPIDTAIVRAAGTVVVPTGAAFDLDSGQVGARRDMPSGDLECSATTFNRTVQAVCGARWARTGLRDFDALYRSAVYGYSYDAPNPIPLLPTWPPSTPSVYLAATRSRNHCASTACAPTKAGGPRSRASR